MKENVDVEENHTSSGLTIVVGTFLVLDSCEIGWL